MEYVKIPSVVVSVCELVHVTLPVILTDTVVCPVDHLFEVQ